MAPMFGGMPKRPYLMSPSEFAALRKSTGLSRVAAAKALGMGPTALQDYEQGNRAAPKHVITLLRLMAAKREALITGHKRDILEYIDANFKISL